jgi:hypothetical protein
MKQIGHESAALALEVYAQVQDRQRDTGERSDALVKPPDWALIETNKGTGLGTRDADPVGDVLPLENGNPRDPGAS